MFGALSTPEREFVRDWKLQRWEIYAPGTLPNEGVLWRASSYRYGPGVATVQAKTRDALLEEIARYASANTWRLPKDQAQGVVIAGFASFAVGGAIAGVQALRGQASRVGGALVALGVLAAAGGSWTLSRIGKLPPPAVSGRSR